MNVAMIKRLKNEDQLSFAAIAKMVAEKNRIQVVGYKQLRGCIIGGEVDLRSKNNPEYYELCLYDNNGYLLADERTGG